MAILPIPPLDLPPPRDNDNDNDNDNGQQQMKKQPLFMFYASGKWRIGPVVGDKVPCQTNPACVHIKSTW